MSRWEDSYPVTPHCSAAWLPALGVLVHLPERQVQQGTKHKGQPPLHTQIHTHTCTHLEEKLGSIRADEGGATGRPCWGDL